MTGSYDIPHTQADYDEINNTISYKPEESWNYEIGAHLNLFDNKIHADFSRVLHADTQPAIISNGR